MKERKKTKILDYLDLIKEPSSLDVLEIAKKANCSERWVWMVLDEYRTSKLKKQNEYRMIIQLLQDLIWLQKFLQIRVTIDGGIMVDEKRRLNEIEKRVIIIQNELGLERETEK